MADEHDDVVDSIQAIRAQNNVLWMDLLRLALSARPDEARAILSKINSNDKEIGDWLRFLTD